jgi:hypothetical protein
MAKHWKEALDPTRHVDHFVAGGSVPRRRTRGDEYSYFVRVAGFTFEFASVAQIRVALERFSTPIQPSSRQPVFEPEKGHWQPWDARLPAKILSGSRRERVVRALRDALAELAGDSSAAPR